MLRAVAGLAIVGMTLSACQDESAVGPTPSTPAEPTPSATPAPEEPAPTSATAPEPPVEEVLAAYRGYWDAWLRANDPARRVPAGASPVRDG